MQRKTPRVRQVLYIPDYAVFTGTSKAALLLSQLHFSQCIYDGWFYKTQEQLQSETGLTRAELEGARKRLVELGLVEHSLRGIPCRSHYRVQVDTVVREWTRVTGLRPSDHPHAEKTIKWTKRKSHTSSQDSRNLSNREVEEDRRKKSVDQSLSTPYEEHQPQLQLPPQLQLHPQLQQPPSAPPVEGTSERPATSEEIAAIMNKAGLSEMWEKIESAPSPFLSSEAQQVAIGQ